MVKSVKLNIGEKDRFEDNYGNYFEVRREEKGYFIYDESLSFGPYEKVLADIHVKDVFACGMNGRECEFYTAGINGLVYKEGCEICPDLKKEIKNLQIRHELSLLPNCKFLSEVDLYKLEYTPDGPFAKNDGYTRHLLKGKSRHIFLTQDGKVFAINPQKEVLPFKKYRKFDSYEEMILYVNSKALEYGSLDRSQNRYLTELFNNLKYSRGIPNKYILKLFSLMKEKLGLAEFQNIQQELKYKITSHQLVDLEELYHNLLMTDADNLAKIIKEHGGASYSRAPIAHACMLEMQEIMNKLISTRVYKDVQVFYKENCFDILVSTDENLKEKISSDRYYDWQGTTQFFKDKPKWFDELCELAEKRLSEANRRIQKNNQSKKMFFEKYKIDNQDEAESE